MKPDEFHQLVNKTNRKKKLEEFDTTMLNWLKIYPDIKSAQIVDWLKEHYKVESINERTARRHINRLRIEHDIEKPNKTRDYQALQQLPPGQQVQVDFGQLKVNKVQGGQVVLYFAAFILAHSRYIYAYFLDRPFKTIDLIQAFHRCFDYYGGIPQEVAIDQDKLMIVSENNGDVIYTYEFERFVQEHKVHMYVCRKADPESKGIVESGAVRYIKHSFMPNRVFHDQSSYQVLFEAWLERTGNKRCHGTIKKVPAEVFHTIEKQHLRPAPRVEIYLTPILTRNVNKDNTIWFNSNRYSVPLGTYNRIKQVKIDVDEDKAILYILDLKDSIQLTDHKISLEKGKLIQNRNHLRDYSEKIKDLLESMVEKLGEDYRNYLSEIYKVKPRYIRDQFKVIKKLITTHGLAQVQTAIKYCETHQMIGASDVTDVVELINIEFKKEIETKIQLIQPKTITDKIMTIQTVKRDIGQYCDLVGELDEQANG